MRKKYEKSCWSVTFRTVALVVGGVIVLSLFWNAQENNNKDNNIVQIAVTQ